MAKKLLQFIGYGIVIWAIGFGVGSILYVYKINQSSPDIFNIIIIIAIVITAYLLARSLKVSSNKEILKYSLTWVVVGVILDSLVTVRFSNAGWQFFTNLYVIVGYLLILIIPTLAIPAVPPEEKI